MRKLFSILGVILLIGFAGFQIINPGGTGTVTSITVSSPLTGGTITSTGTIGLGTLSAGSNGLANSATTDTTNASNISSGTLPVAQLPSGIGRNLYTESSSSGTTTNSNSGAAVNMFTGYTLPASTLTAGHSLRVNQCFKHSTGSTSTTYDVLLGATSIAPFAAAAGTSTSCVSYTLYAVDSTHQSYMQGVSMNVSTAVVNPVQQAVTLTLTNSNVINFTQTASGTSDVYTAYLLTVDLF